MKPFVALLTGLTLLTGCSTLVAEAPSNYMVFFQRSDTQLSPDARAVVDRAALAIRGAHPGSVMIAAGTGTGDNLRLAEPRFMAVRQALIADGVAGGLIARSAISDASLGVGATGDQRVEITLVAKLAS